MLTPDAAMLCSDSMPGSSHSREHSQECCMTMPSMHATFIWPASAHAPYFSPVLVAVLPGFNASQVLDSPSNIGSFRLRHQATGILRTDDQLLEAITKAAFQFFWGQTDAATGKSRIALSLRAETTIGRSQT